MGSVTAIIPFVRFSKYQKINYLLEDFKKIDDRNYISAVCLYGKLKE